MKRILVVALLVSLIGAGAYAETPEWSTIEKVKPPKVKDYLSVTSEDGWVTVYYDVLVHEAPPVERYAALYEHVDQHFRSVNRNGPLHIYMESYKKFERRMNKHWSISAEQMRQGLSVFVAHTYAAKDLSAIIVETYQQPTDNVIIHELTHHYFNSVARDGSLNLEQLVTDYAYHIESVFRTELEEEY